MASNLLRVGLLQLGVIEVDLGVDHRHDDVVAGRDLMRLAEVQLAHRVLRRIAAALGERRDRGGHVLRRRVLHVGVRRRHDLVLLQPQDDVAHRHAGRKLQVQRVVAVGQRLRAEHRQAHLRQDLLDVLLRDVLRDLHHDLVRNELAGRQQRREAGAVAAHAAGRALRQHRRERARIEAGRVLRRRPSGCGRDAAGASADWR